jgi:hypothetical protein
MSGIIAEKKSNLSTYSSGPERSKSSNERKWGVKVSKIRKVVDSF